MTLSVGFRITVSLLILLPKLRGSDSYPGGTDSHRTRQPSLDAQRLLRRRQFSHCKVRCWPSRPMGRSETRRRAHPAVILSLTLGGVFTCPCFIRCRCQAIATKSDSPRDSSAYSSHSRITGFMTELRASPIFSLR